MPTKEHLYQQLEALRKSKPPQPDLEAERNLAIEIAQLQKQEYLKNQERQAKLLLQVRPESPIGPLCYPATSPSSPSSKTPTPMKTLFFLLLMITVRPMPHPQNYLPTSDYPKCTSSMISTSQSPRPPLQAPSHTYIDTLPDLPSLHASIDAYYSTQAQTQLLEFQDAKKGEWLKFLPNLGITYTVDGQPRPSISISSAILYQAKKAKQTRAAKRQSILQTNRLAAQQAKNQLADLILQYEQLQRDYQTQQQLFNIETDLFRIQQQEYERQERAPSDFLRSKKMYLLQQQTLEQLKHQLERLVSGIKMHCHY
jgi:hypothetical protein